MPAIIDKLEFSVIKDRSLSTKNGKNGWSWQMLVSVALCLPLWGNLYAQKVSVDDEGQLFLQFEDGSSKKYEASDSMIFEEQTAVDMGAMPKVYDYRTFQRYAVAAVKYESEMLTRLHASQSEYDDLHDKVLQSKSQGESEKLALLQHELSKKSWRLQDDRRILSYARRMIKNILRIGKQEKYEKLSRIYVPGLDRVGRDLVTGPFVAKKETANDSLIFEAATLLKMSEDEAEFAAVTPVRKTRGNLLAPVEAPKVFASVLDRRPPEQDCSFHFEGSDELTGEQKTELDPEIWFTYTDPRLKSYLKEQTYISCSAFLSSLAGGFRYLTIQIEIHAINAKHTYGSIQEGSLLNIRFINGKTVALFSQNEGRGTFDKKEAKVIYTAQYPIDYQKERQLLKNEVDEIRLIWSSGYEDYRITNVDLLIHQLECLNNR